jgi:hypothetical protein
MKITITDNLLTIERDGYNPVTFVYDGRDVRVVHGVALKGDHDLALSAYTKKEN